MVSFDTTPTSHFVICLATHRSPISFTKKWLTSNDWGKIFFVHFYAYLN